MKLEGSISSRRREIPGFLLSSMERGKLKEPFFTSIGDIEHPVEEKEGSFKAWKCFLLE